MKGKIIKLTGGFYYIESDFKIYETRARGNFRKKSIGPIVGDMVEFKYDKNSLGYIEKIYPRKNELIRPKVSNIDQILIVIPTKNPNYNLNLLDKMICYYESLMDIVIVINKYDLDISEADKLKNIYEQAGFEVFLVSNKYPSSYKILNSKLNFKTSALCGVSGAGKSTIISKVLGREILVGDVSEKTKRGKHTTRHVEIFSGKNETYIFDTPGFSSIELAISSENLNNYFREFREYSKECKFRDCKHIKEPKCNIKKLVDTKLISESRYNNYLQIYNQLLEKE